MPEAYAVAFFGPGEVSSKNVAALLEDLFPDEVDLVPVVPVTKAHLTKGMLAVLDWFDKVDQGYVAVTDPDDQPTTKTDAVLADAAEIVESDKVGLQVLHTIENEVGADPDSDVTPLVVILYGDGDEETDAFVYEAVKRGYRCLDLTAGLAEIQLDASDLPETDGEDEEPPARGEKGTLADLDDDLDDLDASEAPEPVQVVQPLPHDTVTLEGRVHLVPSEPRMADRLVGLEMAHQALEEVVDTLDIVSNLIGAVTLRPPEEFPLAALAKDGLAQIRNYAPPVVEVAAAPKTRGRPRKDGSPAQPADNRIPIMIDGSGQALGRVGRGRPPKDAVTVKVSPEDYALLAGTLGWED